MPFVAIVIPFRLSRCGHHKVSGSGLCQPIYHGGDAIEIARSLAWRELPLLIARCPREVAYHSCARRINHSEGAETVLRRLKCSHLAARENRTEQCQEENIGS